MNDKGKQFYDYIVSTGIKVPDTYEEFQASMQDSETVEKFHAFVTSKGIKVPESIEDFSLVFNSQEEELTEEMMETGQRNAAPEYAMTEDKFEAEKKKDGESPLPDGVSVGVEAEIPPTPTAEFATYEEEVKEPPVIEAPAVDVSITDDSSEAAKKVEANTYRSLASLSRVPQLIAEQVYTMFASDEDKEALSKMSQEQRDAIISSIYQGPTSLFKQEDVMALNESGKKLREDAEVIEATMKQYDQSIYEDITGGELGRASARIANEAIGSVPSMVQAMIPYVGISSIVMGSAAEKSRELQEEGDTLNWKTSANSIINGAAEGLLEVVTKRIGSKFFNSFLDKADDIKIVNVKEFAKEFAKDFGAEGLSESATLAIQKMSDYLLNEDEDAFTNSLGEFVETFLIGGVATGPLSGGSLGVNKIRQVADKKKIDKTIAETKFDDLVSVFKDKDAVENMDDAVIKVSDIRSTKPFLEGTVKGQVKRGEITPEEGDQIVKNYNAAVESKRSVEGLDIPEAGKPEAMRLVNEKKRINEEITGKDEALTAPKRERINDINTRLEQIARGEGVTEDVVTEEKPTPRVFETPTDERYAVVNEGKGEGDRVLTKTEYDEYVAPAEEVVVEEAAPTEDITVKKKDEVQTGKPLKIRYNKNPQKAPDMGAEFGQDVEASGDYVTQKVSDFTPEGFETGVVESKNPLVIDIADDTQISYKNELSQRYEGKVGEELSEAIRQDGYDAIVTKYDDGSTGEIVLLKEQRDAIQEPSTEEVDVQEPARDSREMGEGDVRETTEEVDTQDQSPEAEAQVKQEADDLADALGLDDDVKFQLETEMTDKQRKDKLEKEADDLMNEVQPENVETIDDVEGVEPIPVNLEENVEPVERTGIKRFKLRDIIGKKLNLLMADKLKIELKDPSKPYNQETNPYVKMGGNFFPLMDKMFGKVAWASITDAATTKIIKGAMDGDLSAVYNMGDGGVDSNIAIPTSLDAALDKLFPPDNKGNVNPKKDEIFQLIKARVLKSDAKEIKKAHKHFKNASTIMEAFKSLTDEEVKVRAAVMNWVVPTSLSNVSTSIELYNKLNDLGISIETLRDENAEQFAKDLPDGAITMIVEVQDENGVPVRERKLQNKETVRQGNK
jgi:hypothetical protein